MNAVDFNALVSAFAREVAKELHRLGGTPALEVGETLTISADEPPKKRGRPPTKQVAPVTEPPATEPPPITEAPAPITEAPAASGKRRVEGATRDTLRPLLTGVAAHGAKTGRPTLLREVLSEFGVKNAAEITDEMLPEVQAWCEDILNGAKA